MVKKLFIILKAKLSKKDDLGDWYKERIKICGDCPLNSLNIPFRKYTWRMWKWYILNLGKSFCSICGCQITAKASIEIEECSMYEIDKEPKWTSIL